MLYCLVTAAIVAVVTILIGKFTDTTGRALGTVFVALLHIAIVFGLVSTIASKKTDVSPKSTEFVVNASILIVVGSSQPRDLFSKFPSVRERPPARGQ